MKKKVKKSMHLKLKDYLQKVLWEDVAVELVGIYPSERKRLEKYQAVFESLRKMEPEQTDAQIVIEFFGLTSEYLSPFYPFYVVYGRRNLEDKGDTLVYTPWAEWLGRDVVFDPPCWLSYERIVAVCLHSMTSSGFTEEEIRNDYALMKQEDDVEEPDWDDDYLDDTMKERLGRLRKWLRWGSFSRKYFGENGTWFVNHFIGTDAPAFYDEIDRQTLKAALREVAQDLVWVARKL